MGLIGCSTPGIGTSLELEGANGEMERVDCVGWKPILPSREDVLTRGTKEQIIAHNETGQERGCWSAASENTN